MKMNFFGSFILASAAAACSPKAVQVPTTSATPAGTSVTAARNMQATMPRCLRVEHQDRKSGVRFFWFDSNGRLVRNLDQDNNGNTVHDLRTEYTADAWHERLAESKGGAFSIKPAHGELGPHGELVRWTSGSQIVTLRWDGTFVPTQPHAAPETAYLHYVDFWHSLHTADRHLFSRSGGAFEFSGNVEISGAYSKSMKAQYESGRLRRLEDSAGIKTYNWRGEDLVEVLSGDGIEHVTSSGGRIRRVQQQNSDGVITVETQVTYAANGPQTIVTKYFQAGEEEYTSTLAIVRCD